jgi:hypothetical protein
LKGKEIEMEFLRKDTSTIMDGMVVRYQCGGFEINTSRNGVSTHGAMPIIHHQDDLDIVVEYLKRAFRQHAAMQSGYPAQPIHEGAWGRPTTGAVDGLPVLECAECGERTSMNHKESCSKRRH